MTLKQPRTIQLHCETCGHTTPLTTAAVAEHALRKHSCATVQERTARAQRRLDRLAQSGPERPCQHNGKHPHGDRVRYVVDKCRCRPCRDAASAYQRDLERRRLYGRTIYVPADTARKHIETLQAAGMGWKRVARAAGLAESVVWKLLYGDPSRNLAPSKRVRPATEQAILAVRLDLAGGAKVDPTGTGRRLQALTVLGWSIGQIATHTGLDRQRLDAAINGRPIVAATATAIRHAYDRLWNQAPPETNQRERIAASRARRRAVINGWAPAMAWDEDTIDDPTAQPAHQLRNNDLAPTLDEAAIERRMDGDRTVTLTRTERHEAVRRLHSQGMNDGQIARQLGYTASTILRDRKTLRPTRQRRRRTGACRMSPCTDPQKCGHPLTGPGPRHHPQCARARPPRTMPPRTEGTR